jgi:hypothetical protein
MKKILVVSALIYGFAVTTHAANAQLASYDGNYQAPATAIDNTSSGLHIQPQPPVTAIQPLIPNQDGTNSATQNSGNNNSDNDVKSNDVSAPPAQGS